jgi:hypothetical protein
MAMDKKEKEWLLYGGIAGGGLLLFLLLHKPSAPAKHTASNSNRGVQNDNTKSQQKTVTPNPNQASLDAQIVQARQQALTAADAGILGIQTNNTNKAIAFNTNQAQTAQTRIASVAQETIAQTTAAAEEAAAQTQAQAEEQAASEQEQAEENQSNNGLFGGMFSFLGGMLPFLGSSQQNTSPMYSNPFGWFTNIFSQPTTPVSNPLEDAPSEWV